MKWDRNICISIKCVAGKSRRHYPLLPTLYREIRRPTKSSAPLGREMCLPLLKGICQLAAVLSDVCHCLAPKIDTQTDPD